MSNPWIPSLFVKRTDGGSKSGVTAYFLIEWKKVFSIAILKFNTGSRGRTSGQKYEKASS